LTEDLARLDSAVCNHETRPYFLDLLGSEHPGIKSVALATTSFDLRSGVVPWLDKRRVFMKGISFRSDIDVPSPFLPTTGGRLQSLSLASYNKITNGGFGLTAEDCSYLYSLNLTLWDHRRRFRSYREGLFEVAVSVSQWLQSDNFRNSSSYSRE
jgi:hypothetical protein